MTKYKRMPNKLFRYLLLQLYVSYGKRLRCNGFDVCLCDDTVNAAVVSVRDGDGDNNLMLILSIPFTLFARNRENVDKIGITRNVYHS